MSVRLKMGIDVDEVLAGYTLAAYRLVETLCGIKITAESTDGVTWDLFTQLPLDVQKKVRAACEQPGFCAGLPVLPGTQEAVRELQNLVDVYVVTSPTHSPTWVWERNEWLREHFGFHPRQVIHTSAKSLVRVPIRIDDSPDHVRDWHSADPQGLSMLWATVRTRNVVSMAPFRVSSWEEVVRRVKAYI